MGKQENCVTSSLGLNLVTSTERNSLSIKASTVSSPVEQGSMSTFLTGSKKWDIVPAKQTQTFWIKQCSGGHYEYIASYVDDVISFSRDLMKVIEEFKKEYPLKGVGEPE
jgi:hypothetical protein